MLAATDYHVACRSGWLTVAGFVFVSYSRGDSAYVTRLVTSLQQAGLAVWLDTDESRSSGTGSTAVRCCWWS